VRTWLEARARKVFDETAAPVSSPAD